MARDHWAVCCERAADATDDPGDRRRDSAAYNPGKTAPDDHDVVL